MSAYICDPEHFVELAAFAVAMSPGGSHQNVSPYLLKYRGGEDMSNTSPVEQANYYANLLYNENVKSVAYRYNEPEDSRDLPGPGDRPDVIEVPYERHVHRRVTNPAHILTMCDGLEYQSCEHPGWETSTARGLLDLIRKAAIRQLPGYDNGPWEFRG